MGVRNGLRSFPPGYLARRGEPWAALCGYPGINMYIREIFDMSSQVQQNVVKTAVAAQQPKAKGAWKGASGRAASTEMKVKHGVVIRGVYKRHGGGLNRVVSVAKGEGGGEFFVVYERLDDNLATLRDDDQTICPIADFFSVVAGDDKSVVSKFTLVSI